MRLRIILFEFVSQDENLFTSKYFCWSRNCVSSTVNMLFNTVQWFPISGSQKSCMEILVFEMFILFCPSFCPCHSGVFSCRVSFVLNILSFNSTKRICVEFVSYSNLPSCGKTYFALSLFRLQIYRTPVAKQLLLLLFACLAVDQNKCHFVINKCWSAHLCSPSHRLIPAQTRS